MLEAEIPTPRKRGILFVVIGVAASVLIGLGAFLVWRYQFSSPHITNAANQTLTPDLNLIPEEETPTNTNSPLVNQPRTSPDRDHDGLTLDEESAFGTSDADPDSDDDGLNDREEVTIYKTDPLNPDSDQDTFPDGEEVKNLYNPNGSGKLFSLDNLQP